MSWSFSLPLSPTLDVYLIITIRLHKALLSWVFLFPPLPLAPASINCTLDYKYMCLCNIIEVVLCEHVVFIISYELHWPIILVLFPYYFALHDTLSRCTELAAGSSVMTASKCHIIGLCVHLPRFAYPFPSASPSGSSFPQTMALWTSEAHRRGVYNPEQSYGVLGVHTYITSWGTARFLSPVFLPVCTFSSRVWGFQVHYHYQCLLLS